MAVPRVIVLVQGVAGILCRLVFEADEVLPDLPSILRPIYKIIIGLFGLIRINWQTRRNLTGRQNQLSVAPASAVDPVHIPSATFAGGGVDRWLWAFLKKQISFFKLVFHVIRREESRRKFRGT